MEFDSSRLDEGTLAVAAQLTGLEPADILGRVRAAVEAPAQASRPRPANRSIALPPNLIDATLACYYELDGSGHDGLASYAFSVDGEQMAIGVATRPSWNGLTIDLQNEDGTRCEIVADNGIGDVPYRLSVGQVVGLLVYAYRAGLWNGAIFRLADLDLGADHLTARFSIDSFMRCGIVNGLLDRELRGTMAAVDQQALFEDPVALAEHLRPLMSLRAALMPDAASIDRFGTRLCAGGTLTLLALARPAPYSDFALAMHRRSGEVVDGQGLLSVIPRAFHASIRRFPVAAGFKAQLRDEVRLSATVLRELYEEVAGGIEAETLPDIESPDFFYADTDAAADPLRWLRAHPGAWRLECTGFGVALVTGGYGFATLLVVQDEEFWSRFSEQLRGQMGEVSAEGIWWVSSRDRAGLSALLRRTDHTADSLQTLVEGLRRLAKLDNVRVQLPELTVNVRGH